MNNEKLILSEILADGVSGNKWELEAGGINASYQLGRLDDGSGNKIVINNESLSDTQGCFTHSEGSWRYEDYGTIKARLDPRAPKDRRPDMLLQGNSVSLYKGDTLRFGDGLRLNLTYF